MKNKLKFRNKNLPSPSLSPQTDSQLSARELNEEELEKVVGGIMNWPVKKPG
jgi:bacteriocin-like protein